jgi:hypothetical protein
LEIEDLAFTGFFHTWSNKQVGDDFVSKKLDRVMANFEWLNVFVNTSVDFLEVGISDHSPALVSVEEYNSYGPKPFKFFNFWADNKHFLDWIKEGRGTEVVGYSMFQLYTNLKTIKLILKPKNQEVFGGLLQKALSAQQALASAQASFHASQGSKISPADATWELLLDFKLHFPNFTLEDKGHFKRGGVLRTYTR